MALQLSENYREEALRAELVGKLVARCRSRTCSRSASDAGP
jgi:hypothetical protein